MTTPKTITITFMHDGTAMEAKGCSSDDLLKGAALLILSAGKRLAATNSMPVETATGVQIILALEYINSGLEKPDAFHSCSPEVLAELIRTAD